MCGISTYNFKQHVASDIGTHGNYMPAENIKSQQYLDNIQNWTIQNKMVVNDDQCHVSLPQKLILRLAK